MGKPFLFVFFLKKGSLSIKTSMNTKNINHSHRVPGFPMTKLTVKPDTEGLEQEQQQLGPNKDPSAVILKERKKKQPPTYRWMYSMRKEKEGTCREPPPLPTRPPYCSRTYTVPPAVPGCQTLCYKSSSLTH